MRNSWRTRCRTRFVLTARAACALTVASLVAPRGAAQTAPSPLPSWNEGDAKRDILAFVAKVTDPGAKDYVPVQKRVAVFDNDGTLWPEQPIVQGEFAIWRLKAMAEKDPSLKTRQPFKAALSNDMAYFKSAPPSAMAQLLDATHGNLTQEQFNAEVSRFFATQSHPKLGRKYAQLAYVPMQELLDHLRTYGFTTYISSGGTADFIRVPAPGLYGIPPDQVIGSSYLTRFLIKDGAPVLWREPKLAVVNDKAGKPVNLDLHIGKKPIFAAGNVRSGGDIAMLQYTRGGSGPSMALVVNHDDLTREFKYEEPDGATLKAAKAGDWTVVSMKSDWKTVFPGMHGG